jgi:hypothetical protein
MGKKQKHSARCGWHKDWHACDCGAHRPAKRQAYRSGWWTKRRLEAWIHKVEAKNSELADQIFDLVNSPEGEIQKGINARYTRDLLEREIKHHADWDAEVVVHKMAAARWMRSCVLELVTDEAVRAQIEALPLVPSDG